MAYYIHQSAYAQKKKWTQMSDVYFENPASCTTRYMSSNLNDVDGIFSEM